MNPVTHGGQVTGTAKARSVASFLLGEATAHRVDPILRADAHFESVHVVVDPADMRVWSTWCHLFRVEQGRTTWRGPIVTAHGSWYGTRIILTGEHANEWGHS